MAPAQRPTAPRTNRPPLQRTLASSTVAPTQHLPTHCTHCSVYPSIISASAFSSCLLPHSASATSPSISIYAAARDDPSHAPLPAASSPSHLPSPPPPSPSPPLPSPTAPPPSSLTPSAPSSTLPSPHPPPPPPPPPPTPPPCPLPTRWTAGSSTRRLRSTASSRRPSTPSPTLTSPPPPPIPPPSLPSSDPSPPSPPLTPFQQREMHAYLLRFHQLKAESQSALSDVRLALHEEKTKADADHPSPPPHTSPSLPLLPILLPLPPSPPTSTSSKSVSPPSNTPTTNNSSSSPRLAPPSPTAPPSPPASLSWRRRCGGWRGRWTGGRRR